MKVTLLGTKNGKKIGKSYFKKMVMDGGGLHLVNTHILEKVMNNK